MKKKKKFAKISLLPLAFIPIFILSTILSPIISVVRVGTFQDVLILLLSLSPVIFFFLFVFFPFLKKARHIFKLITKGTTGVAIITAIEKSTPAHSTVRLTLAVSILDKKGISYPSKLVDSIPFEDFKKCQPGNFVVINYDPVTFESIFMDDIEATKIERLIDATQASLYPNGLEPQIIERLRRKGERKTVLIKDMAILEAVEQQFTVTITVQLSGEENKIMKRTLSCPKEVFESLTIGSFTDIQLLPYEPEIFALVQNDVVINEENISRLI